MSRKIDLVCFDLGGVLVRLVRNGWQGACDRANVKIDVNDAKAWAKHAILLQQLEIGKIDEAAYIAALPDCLPGIDCAHALRAFDAWLMGMYPGADAMLDEIKSRGVKTACLSNTNARHWRALSSEDGSYAALRKLDHLIASHEIGVAKPDEQAYRLAEEVTGVRGDKVLFFDDRTENIEAARSAGWNAEMINRVEDAVSQMWKYLQSYGVL
jgi:glucose-1-phosphatase